MIVRINRLSFTFALVLTLALGSGCKKETVKKPATNESASTKTEKQVPKPPVVDPRQKSMDTVYEAMVRGDAGAVAKVLDLGADTMAVLTRAVNSNNINAMQSAVAALSQLGADEAGALVLKALQHDAPTVRVGALEAAAAMKLKDAAPQALALLNDKEADIQAAACDAAKRLEVTSDKALKTLFKALQSENLVVQVSCADAFAHLASKKNWAKPVTDLLLNSDANARIGGIRVLGIWRDDRYYELLLGRMSDANAHARAAAISAVAGHKRDDVVRELSTHLEDDNPVVRIEAVAALGLVQDADVQGTLYQALYDKSPAVRTEAMSQLHRFSGDARCALKVAEFLTDEDEGVRETTALTLLRLKDPRTFEAMSKQMALEKSVGVRVRLISAIAQSNPRTALPFLIETLAKAKGREVGVIVENLAQISGQDLGLKPDAWKKWWTTQRAK